MSVEIRDTGTVNRQPGIATDHELPARRTTMTWFTRSCQDSLTWTQSTTVVRGGVDSIQVLHRTIGLLGHISD